MVCGLHVDRRAILPCRGRFVGNRVETSLVREGPRRIEVAKRRPGTTARDEILDRAGELFRDWLHGKSPRRLDEAGLGIEAGMLYNYFSTKDELGAHG